MWPRHTQLPNNSLNVDVPLENMPIFSKLSVNFRSCCETIWLTHGKWRHFKIQSPYVLQRNFLSDDVHRNRKSEIAERNKENDKRQNASKKGRRGRGGRRWRNKQIKPETKRKTATPAGKWTPVLPRVLDCPADSRESKTMDIAIRRAVPSSALLSLVPIRLLRHSTIPITSQ